MLGVLKRRWKPKRASNGNRLSGDSIGGVIGGGGINTDITNGGTTEMIERPRGVVPSIRQIHPVCDEKTQLHAYENIKTKPPVHRRQNSHEKNHVSRDSNHSSRDSNPPVTTPTSAAPYPLTPNICVEGGRIEFIKTSPDVDSVASFPACSPPPSIVVPPPPPLYSPPPPPTGIGGAVVRVSPTRSRKSAPCLPLTPTPTHKRYASVTPETRSPITVTRSQQTDDYLDDLEDEKFDIAKECLEERVLELEMALENEHRKTQNDKLVIAKLQRQLARRESAHRDAEREKRLRAESDARARDAVADASRCRARCSVLTHEFAKMEDAMRTMLLYKTRTEQLKQEKASLTLAFEARSQQYQTTISRLSEEVTSLRQQLDTISSTSSEGRVTSLEAENASLTRQVQEARKQYERCLDDVANQVVRALLSQKTLREEIGSLTRRIHELETQNRALTSLLVQQLRTGSTPTSVMITPTNAREQLALESSSVSPNEPLLIPQENKECVGNLKHSNSFNFDSRTQIDKRFSAGDLISSYNERVLPNGDLVACINEKRLSADVIDRCEDTGLSLEDKKRHQVLSELWMDLQKSEVTPQKLLNALTALEPSFWATSPAKRPATLDLTLPTALQTVSRSSNKRTKPVAQVVVKPEEEPGTESPESGNRDEGYSTMSSDVQGEVNRSQSEQATGRGLEDLAEATDETETQAPTVSENITVVVDHTDPDIVYIPINVALKLNPRNSYPPTKTILPFQHVMRSFSDSHLCLKITTAPSPCYSISSPISSTPSILLLDMNPLRRARNASLIPVDSWGSNLDAEQLTGSPWDKEYVQHWLKLDETRTNIQQRHRDLLELEYDRAELEDWSLSLSADDVREGNAMEIVQTPGQISIATLPSIQEGIGLELEEDSSECLWNDSSYLADKAGGEIVSLLMDTDSVRECENSWPYATTHDVSSPPESWSSVSEDDPCSKRSSAAMSGCSDEAPLVGTDFTRDFYRLVKFESTKSLASCSSRGTGQQQESLDREQALQNVLNFIAEQQIYCHNQEHRDSRPTSARSFNIDGPLISKLDEYWHDSCPSTEPTVSDTENSIRLSSEGLCQKIENFSDSENYVTLKHLQTELALNEQNTLKDLEASECIVHSVDCEDGVCITSVSPSSASILNHSAGSSEKCDENSELCTVTTSNEVAALDRQNNSVQNICNKSPSDTHSTSVIINNQNISEIVCDASRLNVNNLSTVLEEEELSPPTTMTESLTSSVSTPDTIVSKIPRRQKASPKQSGIPVSKLNSPSKTKKDNATTAAVKTEQSNPKVETAKNSNQKTVVKSRIPFKHKSTIVQLVKKETEQEPSPQPVITSERLPPAPVSGVPSSCSVIDGPPHRAVSFHERATSKDVIDELNRMIRKGDDSATETEEKVNTDSLDVACCCTTGWVHVERDIDFTDPKARANLLDVMLASSDSSPTSSCGGSMSSDSTEEHSDYKHLHKLHRYRRQKKESNSAPCTPSTETAV